MRFFLDKNDFYWACFVAWMWTWLTFTTLVCAGLFE
jgi:hypothetical protein